MAGALTISTLNNDTGVLATQNGMTGIPKAWLNYNGSTQTIRDSFNVSSVTRNGTGDFTLNFSTAMANSNYVLTGCIGNSAGGSSTSEYIYITTTSFTTTSARFYPTYGSGVQKYPYDAAIICLAIIGT